MAWDDWFIGSPSLTVFNISSSQVSVTQNTHVVLCVFINIIGALTANGASCSLCVEECSFIDCFRSANGGAIFFVQSGNFILSKICVYQCTTSSSHGQFCYIYHTLSPQNMSIVHLISVCKCSQYDDGGRYTSIYFGIGNITLNNINSSANKCAQYSGVLLQIPSHSCTAQSTFSNNTDDKSICIRFRSYTNEMKQCNIIKNHQKLSDSGTIYNTGSAQTTLSYCIIDMNTGAANIIYVDTGSVTLQNCYFQSFLQTYGFVSIEFPISHNNLNILNHFNSHMCLTFIPNLIDDAFTTSSYLFNNDLRNTLFINVILTQIITISL